MTLLELVSFLRTNILDDTGGHDVDWASYSEVEPGAFQMRWGNEELVANINESIRQVYKRINPVQDSYALSVLSGVKDYTLPSYIRKVLSGRRADGRVLEEKSVADYLSDDFETNTGDLEAYIPDQETGKLRIYPEPVANETVTLLVYRYPKTELTWDSPDSSPELRLDYQIPMLNYAAFLCYMKDEANSYDPQRANTFSALFDREFPFTSSYSSARKARTTNRPVKFRY